MPACAARADAIEAGGGGASGAAIAAEAASRARPRRPAESSCAADDQAAGPSLVAAGRRSFQRRDAATHAPRAGEDAATTHVHLKEVGLKAASRGGRNRRPEWYCGGGIIMRRRGSATGLAGAGEPGFNHHPVAMTPPPGAHAPSGNRHCRRRSLLAHFSCAPLAAAKLASATAAASTRPRLARRRGAFGGDVRLVACLRLMPSRGPHRHRACSSPLSRRRK